MPSTIAAGESRGELLAWVNDLLALNLTKIEQMGTGAPLCQIIDSIYGDVTMSKVKFNALHEYEYVANFKVLQDAFERHHIDKIIPVERLIKLKFQDNLEFLQWLKRFWDANYHHNGYDAIRRRTSGGSGSSSVVPTSQMASKRPSRPVASHATLAHSVHVSNAAHNNNMGSQEKQVTELKQLLQETVKERDFYYNKLRQIEILTQPVTDILAGGANGSEYDWATFVKAVNETLYATEEGFEIPKEP